MSFLKCTIFRRYCIFKIILRSAAIWEDKILYINLSAAFRSRSRTAFTTFYLKNLISYINIGKQNFTKPRTLYVKTFQFCRWLIFAYPPPPPRLHIKKIFWTFRCECSFNSYMSCATVKRRFAYFKTILVLYFY